MSTRFLMRPQREHPDPNPQLGENAVLRLVNDLAFQQDIVIDYIREQRGSDNRPLWVVKPIIMGEVQPLEGSGLTVQAAKKTCALAILYTNRLVLANQTHTVIVDERSVDWLIGGFICMLGALPYDFRS